MGAKVLFVLFTTICMGTSILIVRESDIKYYLYTSGHSTIPTEIKRGELATVTLDSSRPVKVIIHGFHDSANSPWVASMKDAYFSIAFTNVIVVDWSAYTSISQTEYTLAVILAKGVGNYVGDLIYDLGHTLGVLMKDVHVVGFALGAHVAGFAGQRILSQPNPSQLGRITSLNAVATGFNDPTTLLDDRLSTDDATFIDAIHTANISYKPSIGHVDFYPNGGESQPGCNSVVRCNKYRAVDLFIESIADGAFVARKCKSYGEYEQGLCDNGERNTMGEYVQRKDGVFYLRTHGATPYACGEGC